MANKIVGTKGDDVLKGTKGKDIIKGKGGNDVLIGKKGNDVLKGGKGDDKLKGGKGNDDLKGQGGEDLLIGGKDADDLYGGGGADIFKFRFGDGGLAAGGLSFDDVIWDFQDNAAAEPEIDRIDIPGPGNDSVTHDDPGYFDPVLNVTGHSFEYANGTVSYFFVVGADLEAGDFI